MRQRGRIGAFRWRAAALLLVWGGAAGAQPPQPSGETILKRVEDELAAVRDYSVTLDVTADIERLTVPPMKARMFFKQPDKIHFDAQGFALLPRDGLALNISTLKAKYNVVGVNREILDSVSMYRVTLQARSERARLRTVLLYVHPEHWTPEQLVTPQTGDRLMNARFRYARRDGYWLPEQMVATFSFAVQDTNDPYLPDQVAPSRQQQKPRTGSVTVRYSDYRINTGLSDDIFKEQPPGGQSE